MTPLHKSVAPAALATNGYTHHSVKAALKHDQRYKCAYCERLLNGDFGHVEHYRPKGGYWDEQRCTLVTPGYHWLTNDWNNLLLSCSECNVIYKRNHFPLSDENARDILHQNIQNEDPLLLNPYSDNLDLHLKFREYFAVPVCDGHGVVSEKGKTTIELLKLNSRLDLLRRREETWKQLMMLKRMVAFGKANGSKEIIDKAEHLISIIVSPDHEFHGMVTRQLG